MTVALGVIVVGAAMFHGVYAVRMPAPWIVPDELIYSELAKSLGAGAGLEIRDEPVSGYPPGYPLLLSPIYAIVSDLSFAYMVVKASNVLIMTLGAVPAFFLARRVLSKRGALAAAALTITIPSMVYAGMVMTEVLFFPVFLLVALLMVRCLERPTLRAQLAAVAGVLLAAMVRPQAVALLPALLLAAVSKEALGSPVGRIRIRLVDAGSKYLISFGTVAILTGGYVVAQGMRGGSPVDAPGVYSGLLRDVSWGEIPRWFILHALELNVYLGGAAVVLAGLVIVRALSRSAQQDPPALSLVLVTIWTSLVMLLTVAIFTAQTTSPTAGSNGYSFVGLPPHIHERYVFYVVPLFIILALCGIRETASVRTRRVTVAVAVTAALAALIPVEDVSFNAHFESLAILPYVGGDARSRLVIVAVVAVVAGCGLLAARRRRPPTFALILATYFVLLTIIARANIVYAATWSANAGFSGSPNWIDRAVERGEVVAVWSERGLKGRRVDAAWRLVWQNEFFNRRVTRVYQLDEPMPYALPATAARVDSRGGLLVRATGQPIHAEYVLALSTARPAGDVVARDAGTGMLVVRTAGRVGIENGLALAAPAGADRDDRASATRRNRWAGHADPSGGRRDARPGLE